MFKVGCALYYSMAKSQFGHWMMDAKGVRNMYSILVAVNKHNTARDASCWFIIYYRLVMHGNSNVKFVVTVPYMISMDISKMIHLRVAWFARNLTSQLMKNEFVTFSTFVHTCKAGIMTTSWLRASLCQG